MQLTLNGNYNIINMKEIFICSAVMAALQ